MHYDKKSLKRQEIHGEQSDKDQETKDVISAISGTDDREFIQKRNYFWIPLKIMNSLLFTLNIWDIKS